MFAALLIPAGRLADQFGRRRLFFVGLAVFTAASGACAVAPSAGFLIGFRVVQAVGGALLVPTSQALLMSEFPAANRSLAVGLWGAAAALAGAAGPPLGGVVVSGLSWRWVFVLNIPIPHPSNIYRYSSTAPSKSSAVTLSRSSTSAFENSIRWGTRLRVPGLDRK